MNKIKQLVLLISLLILTSCATSKHGTFVASTYVDPAIVGEKIIGKVSGESRQTWFLYIFPVGKAPSTDDAIRDAKSKIEGTQYLTDLSIDDRNYFGFGYSEHAIEVQATASK